MITGFNTDIQYGGVTYHVQTEDKGLETPLILSLVYVGGAIIASKRSRYEDLIESGFDEQALTERLQRQHKLICAAIKQGRVDDLKKMAEPPAKREATAKQAEQPKPEEPPKPKTPPKQAEQPQPEKQTEPDKSPRRETAKRAEPPARRREPSPEEPRQEPRQEPQQEPRPEPRQEQRQPPPETKRETPPAPQAPPAREATPASAAPVNKAAPAGETAPVNTESPLLLTGEDQYLDDLFHHGTTGALQPEQSAEVERTPEPTTTAPLPSPPPPFTPPPPVAQTPPTASPLNQPPPTPSLQSQPPPMLIPSDAVRVIEETPPGAFVGAAEEIYLTLLDDEGEFRAGQLATIKIRVGRGQFGQRPVADAAVTIKVLGTTFRPLILSTRTGADGVAVVRALLPRFTSGRAAIIIRASAGEEFAEMRRIIHQA